MIPDKMYLSENETKTAIRQANINAIVNLLKAPLI